VSISSNNGEEEQAKVSTRVRIVRSAVTLFAEKGYTETSIRELANAGGFHQSNIYYHFASKNGILQYILKDFAEHSFENFTREEITAKLLLDPTPDAIISCMSLDFPKGLEQYFLKILCVLQQEQHRNAQVRAFMIDFIRAAERFVGITVEILKEMKLIRQDTDPDYWSKIVSSIAYAFSSRYALGISESFPGYVGMTMTELLKNTFHLLMTTCAATE